MLTKFKSTGIYLIIALGLQSLNSATETSSTTEPPAPTVTESTPVESIKPTTQESTQPSQTTEPSAPTTTESTTKIPETTSTEPMQSTTQESSTPTEELSSTLMARTPSQTSTTTQATETTPTFESIKLKAMNLKNTISEVENMNPANLERDESISWWINFVSNKNKTMTFFNDLKTQANSVLSDGSSETNMKWWNDLKNLKASIVSMKNSETNGFKLSKLTSAESTTNDIESSINRDISDAINSLDKITQNVTNYLKLIESEMAAARDQAKPTPSRETGGASTADQRANALQRNLAVTRQSSARQSMSRGNAQQAAPTRSVRTAVRR